MNSLVTKDAFLKEPGTPAVDHGHAEEYWSEAEEEDDDEASPKRKRQKTGSSRPLSVSCELCKQRKVKCDRGQPACGWCVRNNQLCEYKERKKPGLRAGYGRELEARLDKLENALQAQNGVIQRLASSIPDFQGIAAPLQSCNPNGQVETPLYPRRSSSASHANHNGRAQSFSMQIVRPNNNTSPFGQQHHIHTPSGMPNKSLSERSYVGPPTHGESPSLSGPPTSQSGGLQSTSASLVSQDEAFPPYDLLYALTDLYFKHINTWCPILHRRTTLDSLFGASTLDDADRILLHSIVATTMRFSTDTRLTEQVREKYHAISKQRVILYGMENSSVKALQALVILALDMVGNSNGPPGWNLLALITRSVVQLGLAVEVTSASVAPLYPSIYTLRAMVLPEPKDFIEEESRRRLFWMVYLLDRYATIATAFEFALDEKEIDRKLPCRDEMFARNQPVETKWFHAWDRTDYSSTQPQSLGAFSYYIEIMGLMSQIHRFLKKPVDIGALSDVEKWQAEYRTLDSKLNSWKFSLPSEYSNSSKIYSSSAEFSKSVNCIWIMLHVTWHTTVIRLHSSAAYPTNRSPIFTPSFSASQRCQSAVEDICTLCAYARNNNMITKLGPPFAFSLWVAARLLLVHGSTIDHQVSPAIYPLVETLREMGVYWKVAERYATLLQRVCDEFQESERVPAPAGGVREIPSTVRILADMRRCAYDLDFLISRQPRQNFGSTKLSSVTPARTPGPNELEYLDVFDFFNMPRLPVNGDAGVGVVSGESVNGYQVADTNASNEFNITNFMYDANSDWFMKPAAG